MRRIVLCADDYGQAPAISQGILELIQDQRISATSCLVNGPDWHEQAQALLTFKATVDIGIHLNLTEGQALSAEYIASYGKSFRPLSRLLARCFLRKIDKLIIAA